MFSQKKLQPQFMWGAQKKLAHDKEVELFIDEYKTKISDTFLQKHGITDVARFWQNFADLCQKWVGKYVSIGDCTGKRLAYEILHATLNNPIAIAIMSDDVKAFQVAIKSLDQNPQLTPIYWTEAACLCGASSIVDYILKMDYVNIVDSKNAVAFAVSSGKEDLALAVATKVKQRGATVDSGNVFLYAFSKVALAEEVVQMFNSSSMLTKMS